MQHLIIALVFSSIILGSTTWAAFEIAHWLFNEYGVAILEIIF